MSLDPMLFRQVMSRFASGITVVTINLNATLHGLTVSAFASLSLEPPLALICIDRATMFHDQLKQAGRFAVNILAHDQAHLSQHFASPERHDWSGIAYTLGPLGLPLLDGTLAGLECRLVNTFDGGDHSIFVGELQHALAREGEPLLYHRSGYHWLTEVVD